MSTRRVQLALNVRDIETATRFYSARFGTAPAMQRPGYANYLIADPPLKLVLFENPGADAPLNHLGVEVASREDDIEATRQFAEAGLAHTIAEVGMCCHAVQDKEWVEAPNVPLGAWEFYTALDAASLDEKSLTGTCCGEGPNDTTACCADSVGRP